MRFQCLIALIFILSTSLHADTVLLNDGTKVEGTIIEETDEMIVLKIKFGQMEIKKKEIKDIQRAASAAVGVDAAELRDTLVLKNGEKHLGLLVSEDRKEIVFDLIMSGKNVTKTIVTQTTFQLSEVAEVKKLTDAQRESARKHMESADAQSRQDAFAETNMKIEAVMWRTKDGKEIPVRKIELDFFSIESDAPDEFLKKAAYRMAKVLAAYKSFFGADRNTDKKIHVEIYGSMQNYYAAINNAVKNPAFYSPDLKMICAGCDLAAYERLIADIRAHHGKLEEQIDDYKRQINNARADVRAQVSKLNEQANAGGKGVTAQNKAFLDQVKTQQLQWQVQIGKMETQLNGMQSEIQSLNRRNDTIFSDYTKQMFATLYHEGFHAFLDNFLFPEGHSKYVPRWLNEGLAQYFEVGRMEGPRLILGQEDRERMVILKKFKKENALLSLEKLCSAGASDFLVHGQSDMTQSTKSYLQSWAFVNWLGEKGRLKKEFMQEYVKQLAAGKAPMDALPTLTGMPNAEVQKALEEKMTYNFGDEKAPAK